MLCLRAMLASVKIEQSCTMKSHRQVSCFSFHEPARRTGDRQLQNLKSRIIQIALVIIFSIVSFHTAFAAGNCKEPETGTEKIPVFSRPLSEIVIGTGRLQFYSAPNLGCAMEGVFVIPKDELIAYAQSDDGWSSVMYSNARNGNTVLGWVKSSRLKATGTVGHQ